jgi:drug/metabolite transporter (DMT)-like permease
MKPPEPRSASPALRGILLYLAAIFLFTCLDTLSKYMTRDYHVVQMAWGRYVFHAAFVLALTPKHGLLASLRSKRPGFQILRASLLMFVTLLFFIALTFLPLADVTAIAFVAPLIVTALAFFVLKEKVGIRRWSAILVGLVGVLIIIRPGFAVIHWAVFAALALAVMNAFYHLATRMLAGVDSPQTTIFYTGLVGAVGFSLVVPFFWTPPDFIGWVMLVALGLLGGLSHYLMILAYARAPASTLAPYAYTAIVWVTIQGYLVFGDFPDAWTMLGAAIIVGSGLYVFYREAQHRRAEQKRSGPHPEFSKG